MEWLPIATLLFHYRLYFMVRYCLQNFSQLPGFNNKLRTILFDAIKLVNLEKFLISSNNNIKMFNAYK